MGATKKLINFGVIGYVIGSLLLINGILMALPLGFSIYHSDGATNAFLFSSGLTLAIGFCLRYFLRRFKEAEIKRREGFMIVTFSWVAMTIFGTLPYILSNSIPDISNAFFETMSGFSTTGASILNNIEEMPHSILFWRSMTQWIGGMGIIVLTIAILPLLGIGGMELFVNEAPGPTKDKIHPRIKETAKRLWVIYLFLTICEMIILMFCGMNFFDAINHALTTTSTGGFSTKQASIAHFDSPLIEAVIVVFMFLAGTNFTLIYFGFKGKLKKLWRNDEFKWYLFAVIGFIALLTPAVYLDSANEVNNYSIVESFRYVSFQVVSIITTTGYASAIFTGWGVFAMFIFFLLLFSGASAGSTSGGMKIVRIVILIKNGFLEFKRRIHPNAVVPVHLNGKSVGTKVVYNLLAFLFLYLFMFVLGSIVMAALPGVDLLTAISSVATSLGNVGPGISTVDPSQSFAHLPDTGKWVLSFLMLFGRLELFTVAVLFSPYFWRVN
jgi:trk system potassium uptake protein TrkH|tara:strand:+ start:1036 stop:2526 length:1491 start_codon:yes stop_codon:yes gene_type:complete